jgi:hypothetical protein
MPDRRAHKQADIIVFFFTHWATVVTTGIKYVKITTFYIIGLASLFTWFQTFRPKKILEYTAVKISEMTKIFISPTPCIYVFYCVILAINSADLSKQHQLVGVYNGDRMCLLRGTCSIFL